MKVAQPTHTVSHTYDALGRKHQITTTFMDVNCAGRAQVGKEATIGAFVYAHNGTHYELKAINHEQGSVGTEGGYSVTDRQGSVRVANNGSNDYRHYYPIGLQSGLSRNYAPVEGQRGVNTNYRFQGSESLPGLTGVYGNDHINRFSDVQLGRWNGVDPLAERTPQQSSYAYMDNDPINVSDPLGLQGIGGGSGVDQGYNGFADPWNIWTTTIYSASSFSGVGDQESKVSDGGGDGGSDMTAEQAAYAFANLMNGDVTKLFTASGQAVYQVANAYMVTTNFFEGDSYASSVQSNSRSGSSGMNWVMTINHVSGFIGAVSSFEESRQIHIIESARNTKWYAKSGAMKLGASEAKLLKTVLGRFARVSAVGTVALSLADMVNNNFSASSVGWGLADIAVAGVGVFAGSIAAGVGIATLGPVIAVGATGYFVLRLGMDLYNSK